MVHANFITFLKVTLLKRAIPEKLVLYGTMFPTISHSRYRRTFSDYTSNSSKAGKGKRSVPPLSLSCLLRCSHHSHVLPVLHFVSEQARESWGPSEKKSQWLRKLLRHLNVNILKFLKVYCFSAFSWLRVFYSPSP